MFRKISKTLFVLLCTVCSLFVFGAHGVLADTTQNYTISCQENTGPLSSYSTGVVCDNGEDVYIDMTSGARVELLVNHFDDRGNISVYKLNGANSEFSGSITSDGNDIDLGSDGVLDITNIFTMGVGKYRVHFYAVDSTCCSVGGQAGIRIIYPTCSSPTSPICTNSSSCQTNGRCVDLGGGREGCVYDEVVCNSPGPCQTLPGSCGSDGSCLYATSSESCSADSDPCTYDECVSSDGGKTASCRAGGANLCSGLVPCGRLVNDPETAWNDTSKCQFCHIIILLSQIINFLMSLVAILTILAIVIVGLLSITSSVDVRSNVSARQKLSSVLSGFVIILVAWLVINTLMVLFGFNDPLGNDAWHIFNCDIE
jgi:hypothetical protein